MQGALIFPGSAFSVVIRRKPPFDAEHVLLAKQQMSGTEELQLRVNFVTCQ